MATKTTPTPLRRVRRILLTLFVLFVGGLFGLYLFGRRSGSELPPPAGEEIDADRLISDDQGRFVLEGVVMTAQREDGSSYSIRANRGEYQLELNEANLTGDVVLSGSRGLSMRTEGLELIRKGRIVVSSAPVTFALADAYRGRANRFEVHFPRDRITLAGQVEISTPPGSYPAASLEGRRLVVFRETHNLIAEGSNVVVKREQDSLEARRISLNFDENDDQILFALASWDVKASFRELDNDGVPASAAVEGEKLSVIFDEATGDPERFEMDAPAGGLARLTTADATGLQRSMQADYLWANFVSGRVRTAQGLGGVTLEERLRHAPDLLLRQICSVSAEAVYDAAGEMTRLELLDAVSLIESNVQASGDRLTAQGDSGPVELVGDRAWIANPQGRLEAPRIELDRESREVRAVDGVRAELANDSSPDLAGNDEGAGPIRIQAETATWTDQPRQFRFETEVRAWQGENFLVSQTLGMKDGDLVASGNVRSVWHKRSPAEAVGSLAPGTEEPPVQISSTDMRFERDVGRLTYEGNAKVVQGARSMACPRLQLQLDENDDFERMFCEAGTKIDDGAAGNRLSGDTAIYNTTVGKVKILGDPVRLNQAEGGTISSRLMVYDFDTGIAEIDSVADDDAALFMTSAEYWAEKRETTLPEEGQAEESRSEDGDLPSVGTEVGDDSPTSVPPPIEDATSSGDVSPATGGGR